jgi:murein L,D-transpeptidase YcbB/YkuD
MAEIYPYDSDVEQQSRHKSTTLLLMGVAVVCMAMLAGVLYASATVKPLLPPQVASKHIQQWLLEPPVFSHDDGMRVRLLYREEVKKLYRSNRFQPIWFDNYEMTAAADLLIQSLRETVADDRHLYSYHLPAILKSVRELKNIPRDVTALDMLLSESFLVFAQDSMNNNFLPDVDAHDHKPEVATDAPAPKQRITSDEVLYALQQNLDHESLEHFIAKLTPIHSGYMQLRDQLQHYQTLASSGLWQIMPDGPKVDVGSYHPDVRILRNSLLLYGDLGKEKITELFLLENAHQALVSINSIKSAKDPKLMLDSALSRKLKVYQQRNGLEATGILDQATREQLQVSPQRIARQIAFNMKRWRHLPAKLGDRYVMVNMADYRLSVVEDDQTQLSMKVIVGRPARRTPTLIEDMSTVVLNPTWTVPSRIASMDILPKVKRDPTYLDRQNLKLIRYNEQGALEQLDPDTIDWDKVTPENLDFRFRQSAGKNNALGQVKFTLPNNMAIYLHDTNHPELFDENYRALSSGCVRVEEPEKLAIELLKTKRGWNEKKIDRVLQSKRTTYVPLADPVPVYLLYWTAWVDTDGQLQLRPDVYQWDQLDKYGSDREATLLASNLINTLSP